VCEEEDGGLVVDKFMSEIFSNKRLRVGDWKIDFQIGGKGKALLLLHGFPETKLAWSKIASQLAASFAVVLPDLPGYGDSEGPVPNAQHSNYSKRNIGNVMVQLMHKLGFENYFVAGHDRGGRVAYRMALDYPKQVLGLAVLNIIPTLEVVEHFNYDKALVMENWLFLSQPAPFPETMIKANASFYLDHILDSWSLKPQLISGESRKEYLRCFSKPEVIARICSEYRASKIDAAYDREDRERQRQIQCPTLVLWSKNDFANDEPLAIWKKWAKNVSGKSMACGHFLMEESPEETLQHLFEFFSSR
jgi:haloacetate dehalogenase